MKLQIVVEDALGAKIHEQADKLGFSISSYARFLLKKAIDKPNKIERALAEVENGEVEEFTLEEFKQQLKELQKC